MYPDEEDTSVEALNVTCCDNIDVRELSRWEEYVGGDVGIEDNGICVNPPMLLFSKLSSRLENIGIGTHINHSALSRSGFASS